MTMMKNLGISQEEVQQGLTLYADPASRPWAQIVLGRLLEEILDDESNSDATASWLILTPDTLPLKITESKRYRRIDPGSFQINIVDEWQAPWEELIKFLTSSSDSFFGSIISKASTSALNWLQALQRFTRWISEQPERRAFWNDLVPSNYKPLDSWFSLRSLGDLFDFDIIDDKIVMPQLTAAVEFSHFVLTMVDEAEIPESIWSEIDLGRTAFVLNPFQLLNIQKSETDKAIIGTLGLFIEKLRMPKLYEILACGNESLHTLHKQGTIFHIALNDETPRMVANIIIARFVQLARAARVRPILITAASRPRYDVDLPMNLKDKISVITLSETPTSEATNKITFSSTRPLQVEVKNRFGIEYHYLLPIKQGQLLSDYLPAAGFKMRLFLYRNFNNNYIEQLPCRQQEEKIALFSSIMRAHIEVLIIACAAIILNNELDWNIPASIFFIAMILGGVWRTNNLYSDFRYEP